MNCTRCGAPLEFEGQRCPYCSDPNSVVTTFHSSRIYQPITSTKTKAEKVKEDRANLRIFFTIMSCFYLMIGLMGGVYALFPLFIMSLPMAITCLVISIKNREVWQIIAYSILTAIFAVTPIVEAIILLK